MYTHFVRKLYRVSRQQVVLGRDAGAASMGLKLWSRWGLKVNCEPRANTMQGSVP